MIHSKIQMPVWPLKLIPPNLQSVVVSLCTIIHFFCVEVVFYMYQATHLVLAWVPPDGSLQQNCVCVSPGPYTCLCR